MINLFLTGGTGFFGKSILSMLKRGFYSEYKLTILSRNPQKFLLENQEFCDLEINYVQGDVRDFRFPTGHFDCILHAGTPAMEMPPGVERDIILKGTEHTLDFARHCGATKFMFVSSGAVYGVQPPEMENISESFPCNPNTEYGIAKLEAEHMCMASGIYTIIPRCFAFIGPYLNRNIHFAIGNFIRDALKGKEIVINGDGRPFRSYMFADDLVAWLMTMLENGENGIPYNVGSDEPISILSLAERVKDVLQSSAEIIVKQRINNNAKPPRYVPDIQLAKHSLGLTLDTPLNSAIALSV